MTNFFNENAFLQNIIFDSYFDKLLDLYNDIKREAELTTDNILSNDYIGLKNTSSDFIELIKNNIVINYNLDEHFDDSDLDDNLNLEFC